MTPSATSPAEPPGLFDGVLARGRAREEVSDRAWLQALLEVEAALARAEAAAGVIPAEHAEAIAAACVADRFDPAALGAGAAASGNPVVPLVRALTGAVGEPAGASVHRGATSQDIIDSAAMLVARRALGHIVDDLAGAADGAARLAAAHRRTIMAGRTLLQQALPTTFGLKAAGWLDALDEATDALDAVRAQRLAVQLGGAVGTLAALGDDGLDVVRHLASELGLAEPALPWHTNRTRVTELAGALGTAAAVAGKVARDVALLAQTEVGEVREAAPGGSSTLPHKRNAIAAVSAVACADQAPGLVATLLSAGARHEHERAAGAWHAEWAPLRALLTAVGSAAAWLRDCLANLEVDGARMRANLDRLGDLLLAERVTTALTPALGRLAAHDLVTTAAATAVEEDRSLRAVLRDTPEAAKHLDDVQLDELLDPAGYLGSAEALVDRALRRHRGDRA